jgi:hypothetical protein
MRRRRSSALRSVGRLYAPARKKRIGGLPTERLTIADVVYSRLDIGQAAVPLVFGPVLDLHWPADIWLGIALVQGLLILSAFNGFPWRGSERRRGSMLFLIGRARQRRATDCALARMCWRSAGMDRLPVAGRRFA